ncbi:MAG TPA: hypothetical protein PKO15_12430 [Fibrobacteria bacterium]|nr:hypothetical protein [Fibrobacteria bacterium]
MKRGFLIRLLPVAIGCMFSGCVHIDVTRVKVDADLALPAPPIVPDSAQPGKIYGQGALRVSSADPVGGDAVCWNNSPVGVDAALQYVVTRHVRILAGGSMSSTPSAWIGLGTNVRNSILAWDFDVLAGTTRSKVAIQGLVSGRHEEEDRERNTPVSDEGDRLLSWMQFAARVRARGSGPWMEFRLQPGMAVGVLKDPEGDADDRGTSASATAMGIGWVQEFRGESALIVGARKVNTWLDEESSVVAQGLVSWVQPF